jgi:hypothetical protein
VTPRSAADALDLGVQEFVALLRCGLDVGVVGMAPVAREWRAVHAVAAHSPAESVAAARVGGERR